jgi:hypothetical protein
MGLTNFPNGITSFGVPVIPGNAGVVAYRDVYFVDGTNGSDAYDGLSLSEAKATVQAALNLVQDEDTIIVMRGSYDEALTTGQLIATANMTAGRGRYVNLIGATPTKWAYDSPQLYNVSGSTATLRMRSPGWRVSGFRLVGDSGSPLMVQLNLNQAGSTADTDWSPGTTIDNCVFYGAVGNCNGIDFVGAPPNCRILDNIFELFPSTGYAILSSSSGIAQGNREVIMGNIFQDNTYSLDLNPRGFWASFIINNYFMAGKTNTLTVGFDNTGGNSCCVTKNFLGGSDYGGAMYIAGTGDNWAGNITTDDAATNILADTPWTQGNPAT